MPLFKKILYFLMLIVLFLAGIYFSIYSYLLDNKALNDLKLINIMDVFNLFKSNYKFMDLFKYIYESLLDTIIYVFSFDYKKLPINVRLYLVIIALIGWPKILSLFKFLTYRGFKVFKLDMKKALANPFYYADFVEQHKTSTYDNIDEVPAELYLVLIPVRLACLIILIFLLPVIVFIDLLFNFVGIIKGITNTGNATDFD